jgi:hypothetical protein
MRTLIAAILMGLTTGAAAQPGNWRLTPEGYGPVRIGMTRAQVERTLASPLRGEAIEDASVCIEMNARRGHPGIFFMFEDGRLTRVSASDGARATTPRGVGVGATEAQVRRAYPRGLRSEQHEYVPAPARYLTFWQSRSRGVRFATDERRRVRTIHVGGPSIQYVEGCA